MKKFNVNDFVKVKLTPFGAKIYYHQYDELIKLMEERGVEPIKPRMPQIDSEGFTKFQFHSFMNLYGEYMTMTAPQVIEGNNIYFIDE